MNYICKNCGEEYPYELVSCKICGIRFGLETFRIEMNPAKWWKELKESEKNVIKLLEGNIEETPSKIDELFKKYRISDNLDFTKLSNILKKEFINPSELQLIKDFIELVSLKSSFAHKAHKELRRILYE